MTRQTLAGSAGYCLSTALLFAVAMSGYAFAQPPDNGPPPDHGPPAHAQGNPPTQAQGKPPLTIKRQGSFFAGGTVITSPGTFDPDNPSSPAGQTLHADHAYVQFQIPVNARKFPLVLWHGCLSTAWESTPDDREGYESIFVRRGFSVHVIDQPRQGRAGKSSVGTTITPSTGDQGAFNRFRLGVWPDFFPGVQFSQDPAALEHFLRQGGANNGPSNAQVSIDAVSALFDTIGPAVLVPHSASGPLAWQTAIKNPKVVGIVAYEPGMPTFGGYVFPEGEVPPALPLFDGTLISPGSAVPLSDFLKLTEIPIQVILGDNIPTEPSPNPALDPWRLRLIFAQQFVDAINDHGGDAEFLHLPTVGVFGNTHFPFSDLNNEDVADLMSQFLKQKGLDKRGRGSN